MFTTVQLGPKPSRTRQVTSTAKSTNLTYSQVHKHVHKTTEKLEFTEASFYTHHRHAPKSNLCAVEDVGALVEWAREQPLFCPDSGQEMAVLHNQNKMVTQFGMSAWVAQSNHKVYSRSVTSCAGMTAFLVVVAQTRIGFLSGGRGAGFLRLRPEDQISQTEDAYARATVALTRAQAQTILFGPLDMKGLPGAATVIGSLVYGVGHCCFFFFFSLAERAITAVPVTALPYEAIVTSSAMPRFHQAETHNKRTQNQQRPNKKPTTQHQPHPNRKPST